MAQCQACRDDHGTVKALLRKLGVLSNKHIPAAYLRASVAQRRALLAGLLDTDGTVAASGVVQFGVTNRRLAEDTRELIAEPRPPRPDDAPSGSAGARRSRRPATR